MKKINNNIKRLVLEIVLILFLIFYILLSNPKIRYNNFIVEIFTEKPYIFLSFVLIYPIALFSPIIAIFYGILIFLIEYDILFVVKKQENENN
jgi:hypothetical protein